MEWIGIGLGLLLACLADYYDWDWCKKEDVRIIYEQKVLVKNQQKALTEGQKIIAVKPPRIEHLRNGLFLFILLSVLFIIVINAYVIHLASASGEEEITFHLKSGAKVRDSVDIYIFARMLVLIPSSAFIFSFILFFVRNKVPYTLIFTPYQLIIYEKYLNKHVEVSRRKIPVKWDKVNSVSTAAYDYFTIHYTDEDGKNWEHVFYHSDVGFSESKFEKIFRKYGVKVEVCEYL